MKNAVKKLNKKRLYLILTRSDKGFKGTVVDWALPCLHWGSL